MAFKYYKIILETQAPLFIGSGEKLLKKDYVVKNDIAYILDMQKLLKIAINNNISNELEKALVNKSASIKNFFDENNINISREISKYTLDFKNVNDVNTLKEVALFIKDNYGNPYIPGSSLKGCLRTIITSSLLRESSTDSEIEKGSGSKVERKLFPIKDKEEKDKKHLFTGLIISDSKPLKLSDLILTQKWDANIKDEKPLPIFRECIKKNTKIEFDMKIDTDILPISIKKLEEKIRNFSKNYKIYLEPLRPINYGEDVIYLGGGVGYISKTIAYPLYKDKAVFKVSNWMKCKFRKHKHEKDISIGVSPHTLKFTKEDGQFEEYGVCKIRFEEC